MLDIHGVEIEIGDEVYCTDDVGKLFNGIVVCIIPEDWINRKYCINRKFIGNYGDRPCIKRTDGNCGAGPNSEWILFDRYKPRITKKKIVNKHICDCGAIKTNSTHYDWCSSI